MLYHRFTGFFSTALLLSSTLVGSIFNESMYFTYSSTGYNFRYGYLHIKAFCVADFNFGSKIRQIRCYHGLRSPFESLIEIMSCHYIVSIKCLLFLFLLFSFSISHIASILVCIMIIYQL